MLIANTLLNSDIKVSAPSSFPAASGYDKLNDRQKRVMNILSLFNSDKRAGVAPFSIQNVAEVGLKDFGVYPGQLYAINTASQVF